MKARAETSSSEPSQNNLPGSDNSSGRRATDVAIVGMSCIYPSAPDLQSFWKAVVRGQDCTRLVRPDEWNEPNYYNRE
ncbi:beta-ketoacyl synthase N-terminal-like domain-containing protein, partial [Acinetobacter baumannii]